MFKGVPNSPPAHMGVLVWKESSCASPRGNMEEALAGARLQMWDFTGEQWEAFRDFKTRTA